MKNVLFHNGCLRESPEACHNMTAVKTFHIYGKDSAFFLSPVFESKNGQVTLSHRDVKTWPCKGGGGWKKK